jgi:hypothetical protein
VAGIVIVAWTFLRGAEVASTERVTLGEVAAQLETATSAMHTAPNVFESFILLRPPLVVREVCGRIHDYSSREE